MTIAQPAPRPTVPLAGLLHLETSAALTAHLMITSGEQTSELYHASTTTASEDVS